MGIVPELSPISGTRWADQDSDFDPFDGNHPLVSPLPLPTSAPVDEGVSITHYDLPSPPPDAPPAQPLVPGFERYCPQTPRSTTSRASLTGTCGSSAPGTVDGLQIPRASSGGAPHIFSTTSRWQECTREIDPTTVFVGGLEKPEDWDEAKLRRIFERFGGIENVQVVNPCTCRPLLKNLCIR